MLMEAAIIHESSERRKSIEDGRYMQSEEKSYAKNKAQQNNARGPFCPFQYDQCLIIHNWCIYIHYYLLRFLRIALRFPESTFPNIHMHFLIKSQHQSIHRPRKRLDPPMHHSMRPIRRTRSRNPLCTTRASNLAQSRSDKLLRVGNHSRRSSNLAHR